MKTAEQAGSNALALLLGAGLAIYGAHVLNGLRAELHESRKFGQYRLLHKLGAGGMGEVYLAEHQLLKRPCALKLIRPGSGADPMALARFEREVRAAARLSHTEFDRYLRLWTLRRRHILLRDGVSPRPRPRRPRPPVRPAPAPAG